MGLLKPSWWMSLYHPPPYNLHCYYKSICTNQISMRHYLCMYIVLLISSKISVLIWHDNPPTSPLSILTYVYPSNMKSPWGTCIDNKPAYDLTSNFTASFHSPTILIYIIDIHVNSLPFIAYIALYCLCNQQYDQKQCDGHSGECSLFDKEIIFLSFFLSFFYKGISKGLHHQIRFASKWSGKKTLVGICKNFLWIFFLHMRFLSNPLSTLVHNNFFTGCG